MHWSLNDYLQDAPALADYHTDFPCIFLEPARLTTEQFFSQIYSILTSFGAIHVTFPSLNLQPFEVFAANFF